MEKNLSDEQKQVFELHVRQNKNKSSDRKQYDRYVKRLGAENMPKTFDKFQELKYNDVEQWNELKYEYRTVNRYEIEGVVEQFKKIFPNSTVNIVSGKRGYNNSENGTRTYKHRKKARKNG